MRLTQASKGGLERLESTHFSASSLDHFHIDTKLREYTVKILHLDSLDENVYTVHSKPAVKPAELSGKSRQDCISGILGIIRYNRRRVRPLLQPGELPFG